MPEKVYIEREALVKELNKAPANFGSGDIRYGLLIAKVIAEKQPTADVAEVKHGWWIPNLEHYDEFTCTNCQEVTSEKTCYCPNCGAKMDGN